MPAKTVKELVAYAKANPGKVHFPSPGFGTQPHLVGEMFKSMTGLDIVHVPYRGSAPAITDLLAGQMQIYFDNFANVLQHVESGKLRALAVTGDARSAAIARRADHGRERLRRHRRDLLERLAGAGGNSGGDRRAAECRG